MRPSNATDGGVRILGFVGEAVMLVVVGFPPVGAHLSGGRGDEAADPFDGGGAAVGFVGKQAVINAGDGEHSNPV